MVVIRKAPVKLILAIFDEYNNLVEIFDTIEHVENMSLEDIYDKVENCFWIYIQTNYMVLGEDRPVFCKCMFIRARDKDKAWCLFGKEGNKRITPYSNKYMSNTFVYTLDGNVEKIYDDD